MQDKRHIRSCWLLCLNEFHNMLKKNAPYFNQPISSETSALSAAQLVLQEIRRTFVYTYLFELLLLECLLPGNRGKLPKTSAERISNPVIAHLVTNIVVFMLVFDDVDLQLGFSCRFRNWNRQRSFDAVWNQCVCLVRTRDSGRSFYCFQTGFQPESTPSSRVDRKRTCLSILISIPDFHEILFQSISISISKGGDVE